MDKISVSNSEIILSNISNKEKNTYITLKNVPTMVIIDIDNEFESIKISDNKIIIRNKK